MAQSNTNPAPHEMLELHELMRSEIIGVRKLQISMPMVGDSELKAFMEQALNQKRTTLHQCEQLCLKMDHQRLQ